MLCNRCSTRSETGTLWCPACGTWIAEDRAVCEGPELAEAIGACVVCGKPVCASCVTENDGKMFCSDGSHQELWDTHVPLGRYDSQFEADWIMKNLAAAGIVAHGFTFRSRPGLYGLVLRQEAAVFIQRTDLDSSREILKQYEEEKGS